MNSLYTPEVRKFIAEHPKPHKEFVVSVAEVEESLLLVFYRDSFDQYPEQKRQDMTQWVGTIITGLFNMGIPCRLVVKESAKSVV